MFMKIESEKVNKPVSIVSNKIEIGLKHEKMVKTQDSAHEKHITSRTLKNNAHKDFKRSLMTIISFITDLGFSILEPRNPEN